LPFTRDKTFGKSLCILLPFPAARIMIFILFFFMLGDYTELRLYFQ